MKTAEDYKNEILELIVELSRTCTDTDDEKVWALRFILSATSTALRKYESSDPWLK